MKAKFKPIEQQKLPWNHNYKMYVSVNFSQGEEEQSINPSVDSSYSVEEWNALSPQDQRQWLEEETKEWAMQYVEYGWER